VFDLATESRSQDNFDAATRVFNDAQMHPKRVAQQQQQIQPKDEDEKA
jgi:hypothetical protein